MPVVSARRMLVDAATHGYAVGAFNVTNIIQMESGGILHLLGRSPILGRMKGYVSSNPWESVSSPGTREACLPNRILRMLSECNN